MILSSFTGRRGREGRTRWQPSQSPDVTAIGRKSIVVMAGLLASLAFPFHVAHANDKDGEGGATRPTSNEAAVPLEEGFEYLFDGTDLSQWAGDTKGYVVEDGLLVCKPGGQLYTKEAFSDFVFRFEFKLTPGANNGLGIRMEPGAHASYEAIELQILDDGHEKYKGLKPYQAHGSVYGVVPAKRGFLKPAGEWNTQEVVADGYHIKITLNGTVIVDADIEEASEGGTMDGKDHPGLLRKSGRIGFIGHGDVLYFRNIRVKRLEN